MDNFYKNFFENLKIGESNVMKGIICIDGVVGVGKSSLGKILAEKYGVELFEEPVVNNPILDKYYYDKERWAFPLQIFFLNKRFEMLKNAMRKGGCLLDRSIYGDVIFAKMLVEDGIMTKEEFSLYEELLRNMLEHIQKPKLMIYLKTTVKDAISKIEKRGRDYEKIVPIEYWEHLNKHYESFFNEYNLSDILIINVDNIDFVNNKLDRDYILYLIDERLQNLK